MIKLFRIRAVRGINAPVTDIGRSVNPGTAIRLVVGAKPSTVMRVTVPTKLGAARRTETGFCARSKVFAIIPFVMNDWFFVHKADDFLGNRRRIFTKRMCDFIKAFMLV